MNGIRVTVQSANISGFASVDRGQCNEFPFGCAISCDIAIYFGEIDKTSSNQV